MDKDYSELIEYLDKKFSTIESKFDHVDEELEKTAKQKDLNELKEQVRSLVNSVDRLTKSIETYHHEQTALGAKVDRLEAWVNQIAKQAGIELKP